ncbi:MAG: methyltransferase domain-containing protein [Ignavibacteria bacterium]|nr:methyltransferase domain-containing protein [Ignavibacteria bacterium]
MTNPHQIISRTPFDLTADDYDRVFERNPITNHIRPIVWRSLLSNFNNGDNVLELNCGTGTDAIMLAEHGIHVTATDSSLQMIEQAREKTASLNLDINFLQLEFEQIDSLAPVTYDGAFSNFGGLNCATDAQSILLKLSRLLKPGSTFIACLLNKVCVWEIASFLSRGKITKAFRRLPKTGVETRIAKTMIHVYYYSPARFARILSPWFKVTNVYGLNIFSPSPNSRTFTSSHPIVTNRLLAMDKYIRHLYPFYALGDHFVVAAERLAS